MSKTPAWKEVLNEVRSGESQAPASPDDNLVDRARQRSKRVLKGTSLTKEVALETIVYGSTAAYTVRKFTDGTWHCTCLAWKNNHASPDHRHCKHTRQVERQGITGNNPRPVR